jgi:hypothetical protein
MVVGAARAAQTSNIYNVRRPTPMRTCRRRPKDKLNTCKPFEDGSLDPIDRPRLPHLLQGSESDEIVFEGANGLFPDTFIKKQGEPYVR